jgi:periplasmic copper chaperone A
MLSRTTTLAALAGAAAAATVLAPAAASAHVSFHPNAIPQGAFVTTDIRVPDEEDEADVTGLRVKLPDGVLDAEGAPPAGWSFSTRTKKLAKPITTDDGTVTSEVTEVDFTGGRIRPGDFGNFPVALGLPDAAKQGQVIGFPTIQTYSNGDVVRWIGTPSDDRPAPTIDVTAPGAAALDVTGGDAGPPAKLPANLTGVAGAAAPSAAAQPATTTVVTKRETSTLSVIALIVGALGLLAGGVALATRRRVPVA